MHQPPPQQPPEMLYPRIGQNRERPDLNHRLHSPPNTRLKPFNYDEYVPKPTWRSEIPRLEDKAYIPQQRIIRPLHSGRGTQPISTDEYIEECITFNGSLYGDTVHLEDQPRVHRELYTRRQNDIATNKPTPRYKIGSRGYITPIQQQTEATAGHLDELKILKAETEELRRQLDSVTNEHKSFGIPRFEPRVKRDDRHIHRDSVSCKPKDVCNDKPTMASSPTEPWRQAVNELCSGMGSVVLVVCKAVNLTGKAALSTCTVFTDNTELASKGASSDQQKDEKDGKDHGRYRRHDTDPYKYGEDVSRKGKEKLMYSRDDEKARLSRTPIYSEHRYRSVNEDPRLYPEHLRHNRRVNTKALPMGISRKSSWTMSSDIDSDSSCGSSYVFNKAHNNLQRHISFTEEERSSDIQQSDEGYLVGSNIHVRRDLNNFPKDRARWHGDEYGNLWKARLYDGSNNFYDDIGNRVRERDTSAYRSNLQIDIGELETNQPVLPRASQYPELKPSFISDIIPSLPSNYIRKPLSGAEPPFSITTHSVGRGSSTNSVADQAYRTHRETQAIKDQKAGAHQTQEYYSVPRLQESSPMTATDKTAAQRISKHQPIRHMEDDEKNLAAYTAPAGHTDDKGTEGGGKDDEKAVDSHAYTEVQEKDQTSPHSKGLKPITKRKARIFGGRWKASKIDSPQTDGPPNV